MADREAELLALRKVQRRVGAIAFFAVAMHGVLGLVGVAHVVENQGRVGDATLLLVMSAVFALVTYAAVRLILGRSLISWGWMSVSFVPTVVGFLWVK